MGSPVHITAKIKAHSSGSGMRVTGTVVAVNSGGVTFNCYAGSVGGGSEETSSSTGSLAGYTMTFQHEFDAEPILQVDGGPFNPYFIYFGGSAQPDGLAGFRWWGDELQVYATSAYTAAPFKAYTMSSSVITLLGQSKSTSWTTIQPYVSGCLETDKGGWWEASATRAGNAGFEQKFGYWEIRCKLEVNNKGIWNAFWLTGGVLAGQFGEHPGEIDIFETIGDGYIHFAVHDHWNVHNSQGYVYTPSAGFAASSTFHTYGMLWTSDRIAWFVDGVKVTSASAYYATLYNAQCGPMFTTINQAIGGWAGSPDGTTSWPARFEIDYVRAYSASA